MENSKELISIIVPLYNAEKFIKDCIQSIQRQTYKNIEIIIVDDGSTDNSVNICKELADEDNRIRIIEQDNQGVSAARNKGIDSAEGDYIGFADNDDILSPYMYEYLYHAINEMQSDLSMCYIDISDSNQPFPPIPPFKPYTVESQTCLSNLYSTYDVDYIYMAVWNKLFRKEAIKDIRFEKTTAEDLVFINKVLLTIKEIAIVPLYLYKWVQHPQSVSHTFSPRYINCLDSYLLCYERLYNKNNKAASACLLKLYKRLLSTKYHYIGTQHEALMHRKTRAIHKKIIYIYIYIIKI